MMMMTGLGVLGAAMTAPGAWAQPSAPLPAQPPGGTVEGPFLFADEFDGPLGASPDRSKWIIQNWQDAVVPPILGLYRDDRRNVFLDGNSNLVLCATKEGETYYSGRVHSTFKGLINTTWESRIKLDCMTPGNWPAYWLLNQEPLPDGEVDVMEFYGNGKWAPGTTVHAASNGKTWEGKSIPELVDNNWHTWRVYWGEDGFKFWRDYTDGADPYFVVKNDPIPIHKSPTGEKRWPFNNPGYNLFAIFNLAIGGSGGGDPAGGTFPSTMLVDWIHVW